MITLTPANAIAPRAERVFLAVCARLADLLPAAVVEHVGATSIPGAVTKGDLDLVVCVSDSGFETAIAILKRTFDIRQPENWTESFASFGDDTKYDLPLGIQLVIRGSESDSLIYFRDYLRTHPEALAEYNLLKVQHAAETANDYWKAKDAFIAKIMAARPH